MTNADLLRLISLAALWGSSFIFMRVVAPVLGAFCTADLRVLIAGTTLLIYFKFIKFNSQWRKNWKHYLIIGTFNSGVPFSLYAFAARHIPASYSVILNSAAPLFGAVFSAIWLQEKLTLKKTMGLFLGAFGVALVSKVGATNLDPLFIWSIGACLLATCCYGLMGVYIKKFATSVKPMAIAGCSQVMAGLVLLPLALLMPPQGIITTKIIINILALAIGIGSVGYILFYRLMADVGPTKALSVTFLMPLFGLIWGRIFLGEMITPAMIEGCVLIVGGTYLVTRK